MKLKTKCGEFFFIDDDLYDDIKDKTLSVMTIKYKNYKRKYLKIKINGKFELIHRYIMNAPKGSRIDHIDNNPMNNRRDNLRFCTSSQNGANRKSTNKTSKYKGVSLDLSRGGTKPFRAQITKNKKTYKLGRYKCERKAALAYYKKAKELHGDFARTNKNLGLL